MLGCSLRVHELSSAAADVCIAWPPGMYLGQSGMTWVPQGHPDLEPRPRLAVAMAALEAEAVAVEAVMSLGEGRAFVWAEHLHCGGRQASCPSLEPIRVHLHKYELDLQPQCRVRNSGDRAVNFFCK